MVILCPAEQADMRRAAFRGRGAIDPGCLVVRIGIMPPGVPGGTVDAIGMGIRRAGEITGRNMQVGRSGQRADRRRLAGGGLEIDSRGCQLQRVIQRGGFDAGEELLNLDIHGIIARGLHFRRARGFSGGVIFRAGVRVQLRQPGGERGGLRGHGDAIGLRGDGNDNFLEAFDFGGDGELFYGAAEFG